MAVDVYEIYFFEYDGWISNGIHPRSVFIPERYIYHKGNAIDVFIR